MPLIVSFAPFRDPLKNRNTKTVFLSTACGKNSEREVKYSVVLEQLIWREQSLKKLQSICCYDVFNWSHRIFYAGIRNTNARPFPCCARASTFEETCQQCWGCEPWQPKINFKNRKKNVHRASRIQPRCSRFCLLQGLQSKKRCRKIY